MTNPHEFFFPGGDGKWDNPPVPDTLEEAQERIEVLETALTFYSDARSYNPDSLDNELPSFDELMLDKGLTARIGRRALTKLEFNEWAAWVGQQEGDR